MVYGVVSCYHPSRLREPVQLRARHGVTMSGRGGTFFTVSGLVLLAYIWMRQSCPVCHRCAPVAATPADQLGRIESTLLQSQLTRIKFLESENAELRKRADAKQATSLSLPDPAGGGSSAPAAGASAALPPPSASGKRQWWYWTDLVMDSLRPFERLNGGITQRGLRLAEQKCKISTWCHRAQVIDGRLYITDLRAIFFDRRDAPLTLTLALALTLTLTLVLALTLTPTLTLTLALALALTFLALTLTLTLARHYAMARVMPLLLTMKRWKVPDLDAVFSGTDYPIMEIPRDAAHMQRMYA